MGALPLSIYGLSHKRAWTLEVAPSCFQGELLPVLSNTLAPALSQYSHTSDKGVETRRGLDCSFPLIPTLFQDESLPSLVFAVSVLYLVLLHWWSHAFRFLRKRGKGKSEIRCHLISFAPVSRVFGFFSFLGVFWRGQKTCGHHRVCQQKRHFKEVLPLSHCVHTLNANPKVKIYYKLLARRGYTKTSCHITKVNPVYLSV